MTSEAKHRLEYAVVEGSCMFPYDMLRYDYCFPALESQSRVLEDSIEFRRAVVARWRCQPGDWTPERWESFGWKLVRTFRDPYEAERFIESKEKA